MSAQLVPIGVGLVVILTGCANPAAAPPQPAEKPPPKVYVIEDGGRSGSDVRCVDTYLGSMWWMQYGEAVDLEYSPDHCPGGGADMEQRR